VENNPLVMLVNVSEPFGIERLRLALFQAGIKVAAVESDEIKTAVLRLKPALIIANLSDDPATDLEMCQLLARLSRAPIITICSVPDEAFRIGLLESMVDDYLVRPVNPRELVARVRNLLHRTQPSVAAQSVHPSN
jgi:DNA-binding response OmpR family regulator